jgi:hypothetical protein
MGYRSDVKVLVYVPSSPPPDEKALTAEQQQEKYEALKLLLKTRFAHIDEEWGGEAVFEDSAEVLVFDITDVKWYDSYPEVQNFSAFLDALNDMSYAYEFGRIGEDTEDVEFTRSSNSDYRLGVERSFRW